MTIRRIENRPFPKCRVRLVDCRLQALARLYARREAVDKLIRSLQDYDNAFNGGMAECTPINAQRKCS